MIVVTGGAGFVGRAVMAALQAEGQTARAISRSPAHGFTAVGEITGETDWSAALAGADAVIHLAARVHVMTETVGDPLAAFRSINVDGTLNLARQASMAGVRRFVFVSSIKVNGEETLPGQVYRADDPPNPRDPYGVSKLEAEEGLRAIAVQTGLEVVIIRPPLIYGPGVRANFAAITRLIARGVPLPLGAVTQNRRSLIAVENLADLLFRCIRHPSAANRTFLASDGEDMSTADLMRRIGHALHRPARLIAVPPALLQAGAAIIGRTAITQRLLGSLQIDAAPTRTALNWTPPLTVSQALARSAQTFRTRAC